MHFIGIDMGLEYLFVTSEGTGIEYPKYGLGKNIINEFIERIFDIYNPNIVVIEDLDYSDMYNMRFKIRDKLFSAYILFTQILYKYDVLIIKVAPAHSSQQCYKCGYIDIGNRVSRSQFICQKCHNRCHADINAARVIRDRGKDVYWIMSNCCGL